MAHGFVSGTDRWWWCGGHQQAEMNPPGINGGDATVGHRWVGPYPSLERCEQSGPTEWAARA